MCAQFKGGLQMTKFTNETNGYEQMPVYIAFKDFFDTFFIKKDYDNMSMQLEEDFECLGVVEECLVTNKDEFVTVLRGELETIAGNLEYNIKTISGKEVAPNVWNVIAVLELNVLTSLKYYVKNYLHVTGVVKLIENDYRISSMHLSKMVDRIEQTKTEKMIYNLVSKSMPGGIVIGYAKKDYPLCFANERYLELLGYSDYEEYYKEADGLGIKHIHPDDLDMVNEQIKKSYNTDTQFGIEYRIRHKDGHYMNVYDIGKKMITPDNKELIICVLYDMTENVRLKESLIRESNYDALTGVYNRGGGIRAITEVLNNTNEFCFMFFDMDNFKKLNDKYSHEAGDHALQYFAELLMEYFAEPTVLVRVGGDEFVACLDKHMTVQKLQRLYTILEQEYGNFIDKNYPESHSSVSIGCVIGTGKSGFEELYRVTDGLMYDIKKHGKRGYKIIELNE